MSDAANTMIAELIKANAGYSAQVDLNQWFPNSAVNLATMGRYKPTVSHRKAFERVAGALDTKDKRAYLITGNYGTGKSHLCLMLANYFAYPSDQPDVARFLDNYAEEDPVAADALRARRGKGRFLIALCDWDSTDSFPEVVLRAVLSALGEAGLADVLATPYEEARRKLERLAAEQRSGQSLVDYYDFFEKLLPQHLPGTTMQSFTNRLYPGLERPALEVFKRIHEEVLRSPFTYEAGNLSAILKSALASPAFRERFEGIVVFWDEFGYTLGDPNRLSANIFQQFAQLCTEPDPTRGKLVFIGTAHRDFAAYAPAWAAADYSKLSDRVEPVNLLPEGLEDVIGAVVAPDKGHMLWQGVVFPKANPIWSQWVTSSKNSGIFPWLVGKPPVYRAKILEGVYPMHPMATFAVINLAREVASQNRTVFTFFSSEKDDVYEQGSYLWYIHNTPITDGAGRLSFYTVDRLFDYFRPRLNTANQDLTPQAKEKIANYEAAQVQLQRARNQNPLELSDTDFIARILRAMLIDDLIGVQNSLDNLVFGLNLPPNDRKVLETQLAELTKHGVVHRHPTTQLYEFRRSDLFDVDRAVEEYKRQNSDKLASLAAELEALLPLPSKDRYLEAKAYNGQYAEDKRLQRRIVIPGDLATTPVVDGSPATYFDLLDREVEREVAKSGDYEGIALHVVCESQADIETTRDLAAKNTSGRVVVAVPTAPIAFRDAVLNLKAIVAPKEGVKDGPQAANFSTQDNALVSAREGDFRVALKGKLDALLDARKLTWLGAYGKAIPADPQKSDDAATRSMQQLYIRRSTFSHDDFNLTHDVRNFAKKHLSLVEAVNALLKTGSEVTIDAKAADNRGEKRYLERCLYQRGALAAVRQQGSVTVVEVQRNTARFEAALPGLADMIADIQKLGATDRLSLRAFVNKYRQPPYGLGDIALSLLLAALLRNYGDTIKIKKDDAAIGDLHIADFDTVAEILRGSYPNAFVKYREIRSGERQLINGVHGLFTPGVSAAQGDVTATDAYNAVATWYETLPTVAQVSDFYARPEYADALRFLEVLAKLRAQDPHAFVLGELQTVAGHESDELVTPERGQEVLGVLGTAKDQVEGTLERVQSQVRSGLCEVFSIQGNTWDDVADGVRGWYNGLDSHQRSPAGTWHNEASKSLIQLFVDLSDPRDIFLEKLPERQSYNFKRVSDWNADLSKNYLAKIREGAQHVERNRIKVPSPARELIGSYREEKGNVYFTGPLRLGLTHSDPQVRIYVTDAGQDPVRSTKERDEFTGSKEFDIARLVLVHHAAVTIQYIPQDSDGNWGVLERLVFIDETLENEIRRPKTLFGIGEKTLAKAPVTFVFPTTPAGVATSCRTFFESLLANKVISSEQLRPLLEEILNNLPTEAKE
jgi:hypothetical protein